MTVQDALPLIEPFAKPTELPPAVPVKVGVPNELQVDARLEGLATTNPLGNGLVNVILVKKFAEAVLSIVKVSVVVSPMLNGAHSMGGGAEIALAREIADHCQNCGAAMVLRVGSTPRWQLEIHSDGNITAIGCNDFEHVVRLLAPIDNRHVIYSCGVGDPDPIALPAMLANLAKGGRLSIC